MKLPQTLKTDGTTGWEPGTWDKVAGPARLLVPKAGSSRCLGLGRDTELDDPSAGPIAEVSISDRFTVANRFGAFTAGYDQSGAFTVPSDPTLEAAPSWVPTDIGFGVGTNSPGPEYGVAQEISAGLGLSGLNVGGRVAVGEAENVRVGIVKWATSGAIASRGSSQEAGTFHPDEVSAGVTDPDTDSTRVNILRQSSWWHFNERSLAPALKLARDAGERVFMAPPLVYLGGGDALAQFNELGQTTNTITQGSGGSAGTVDRILATGAAAKVAANLNRWLYAFRARWGLPKIGAVLAVPPFTETGKQTPDGGEFTQMERVHERLSEYLDAGWYTVGSDDLPVRADNVHLTGQSSVVLGQRMAQMAMRLSAWEIPSDVS